jgi:hypothetical protein
MARPKPDKPEGRDVPIEDPRLVQVSLRLLFEAETEFPIKVEGTSTLPYSSRIQSLDFENGRFILKLVRPLPHELMAGAVFRLVFAVDEQRLEGLITFMGREGYLQYAFQVPPFLFHADRRRHKRYPFRPRENAYVIAQDSGIPGLGLAGPLVNISMGGFALRVDRVLKLDDGMRIPPNTALFERGKGFNRVRIQDLPRLRLLETRAIVSHARERGSEVILGLTFNGMGAEEEAALAQALDLREKIYHIGLQLPRTDDSSPAVRAYGARAEEADFLEPLRAEQEPPSEVTMVLRLQRRTCAVVLVMADTPLRATVAELLRRSGYHRLELLEDLAQVGPFCQAETRGGLPHLVVADLALAHTGDAEPLAAVRVIERELAQAGDFPAVILCESVDPTLLLAQAEGTRCLPYDFTDEDRWIGTLDGLITSV